MALILNCDRCNKPITASTKPEYDGGLILHAKCLTKNQIVEPVSKPTTNPISNSYTLPFDIGLAYRLPNKTLIPQTGMVIIQPYNLSNQYWNTGSSIGKYFIAELKKGVPIQTLFDYLDDWKDIGPRRISFQRSQFNELDGGLNDLQFYLAQWCINNTCVISVV